MESEDNRSQAHMTFHQLLALKLVKQELDEEIKEKNTEIQNLKNHIENEKIKEQRVKMETEDYDCQNYYFRERLDIQRYDLQKKDQTISQMTKEKNNLLDKIGEHDKKMDGVMK